MRERESLVAQRDSENDEETKGEREIAMSALEDEREPSDEWRSKRPVDSQVDAYQN